MTKEERYKQVLDYFDKNVGLAETELVYNNPFELLVSVILSAQCTDKRVNLTTPKLFKDYPTAEAMAAASPETIFSYIRSISYPNNKAKHLVGMANMLVKDFNSVVPGEVDELVKMPGVGRKTANVIASVIYDKPTMAVDTHVFRVSNRIGLTTNAKNPLQSEKQLIKFIPEHLVPKAHHWLILHGRYVCLARNPKCEICPIKLYCKYYEQVILKQNKQTTVTLNINPKRYGKKTSKKIGEKTDEKSS
ncbi:MAG: endonuclease III [Bacteroidetes bacterium]|nr:endonuclease III [Bacteroidota bacterium]